MSVNRDMQLFALGNIRRNAQTALLRLDPKSATESARKARAVKKRRRKREIAKASRARNRR